VDGDVSFGAVERARPAGYGDGLVLLLGGRGLAGELERPSVETRSADAMRGLRPRSTRL
jgi:hypothetical protein